MESQGKIDYFSKLSLSANGRADSDSRLENYHNSTALSTEDPILIRFRNPRPLGVVRVNWLCLDELPGVLEYWSIGVLGLGS